MDRNKRIVFFSSGDFAVNTLISLLECRYNVVGIVTSKDRHTFKDVKIPSIADVAKEWRIPYIVADDPNSDESYNWIKMTNADIFCVISYKKLSERVLSLARKVAFNVHASLLPFLRGAAPINYALRNGYEKTGLTAFVLSDIIDGGDILQNTVVDISPEDNFKSLYWKLSDMCVDFTRLVLDNIMLAGNFYIKNAIKQVDPYKDWYSKSPKIDSEYTKNWDTMNSKDIMNLLRSVSPVDGLFLRCFITDKKTNTDKEIAGKIFKAEIIEHPDKRHCEPFYLTDKKSYLDLIIWNDYEPYIYLSVKEIQLSGKKRMSIEEFLRGFQCYLNREKYDITFSDY